MSVASPEKITILIADDHPVTRTGIRATLVQFSDMEVVGEAENGFDAQFMVTSQSPRIVLLDLRMPDLQPALFTKWVREFHPGTFVLVLTFHVNNVSCLGGMMNAGASGYLSKAIPPEQLADAIRRASRGEVVFDCEQLIAANQWKMDVDEKIKQLTSQETEMIKMLIAGKSNQDIGTALEVSAKTVAYHLTKLYTKLNVEDRYETVMWAMENLLDNLDLYPYLERDLSPGRD